SVSFLVCVTMKAPAVGAQTERRGVAVPVRTSVGSRSFSGGCHESDLPSIMDAAPPPGIPSAEGAVAVSQPGVAVETIARNAAGGDIQLAIVVVIVDVDVRDRQALRGRE